MDFWQTNEVPLEALMPVIKEQLANGKNVWLSPKGISMLPMIRQGIDRVMLSPLPDKLNKYDLPLYQRDNGQFVLHRIIGVGETYICIGDNQFVYEPGVRHEQMIALVTVFSRKGKEIPVGSPAYQIYCRYWHYSRPLRRFWRRGISWLRRHLT